MAELIEAARAAKEYLQQKEPMTGEVTELVAALQTGIEEAEKDRMLFKEHLENQIALSELALRVSCHL